MEAGPLPLPLQRLRSILEAAGFRLTKEGYDSEHFGNRVFDFKGRALCVRFVLDRGIWEVDISPASCIDYYPAGTWRDYLDTDTWVGDSLSLDAECSIVAERLADMQTAAEDDPRLLEGLRHFGSKRLGLW